MVWVRGSEVPFSMNEEQGLMPSEVGKHFAEMLQHDLDQGRLPLQGKVEWEYLYSGKYGKNTVPGLNMGGCLVFSRQIRTEPSQYTEGKERRILSRRPLRIAKFEYDLKQGNYYPVHMFYGGRWFILKNETEFKLALNRVITDPQLKKAMQVLADQVASTAAAVDAAVIELDDTTEFDPWNQAMPPMG